MIFDFGLNPSPLKKYKNVQKKYKKSTKKVQKKVQKKYKKVQKKVLKKVIKKSKISIFSRGPIEGTVEIHFFLSGGGGGVSVVPLKAVDYL